MAAKVPRPAGAHSAAGDWVNSMPVVTGTGALSTNDAVQAGVLGPPDLVLPFQPANSSWDVDDADTYAIGTARKVKTFAWAPTSVTGIVGVTYDPSTGTFTFATSATNQSGFLIVWFG